MDDRRESNDPIERLLAEHDLLEDDGLRSMLQTLRSDGTAVEPMPSHTVSRLMRRPRRVPARRGPVVAIVVAATVLVGGAAAASPLSPLSGSATAVLSGLLGANGSDAPAPLSSAGPGEDGQSARGGVQPPFPSPGPAGRSSDHPAPDPRNTHAPEVPRPGHTHPAVPTPHPTPRSTHAPTHP